MNPLTDRYSMTWSGAHIGSADAYIEPDKVDP
jgi:hypothetical protein